MPKAIPPKATYNFNADATTSNSSSGAGYTSPGTFDNWQVQGGSDVSMTMSGGIDANGYQSGADPAGNALFATWNRAAGTYDYVQITNYYANPTNTALQTDVHKAEDGAGAFLDAMKADFGKVQTDFSKLLADHLRALRAD